MISFSHVHKRYPGGYEAVNDVSFAIEAGELVLITGHSGAGKSTVRRATATLPFVWDRHLLAGLAKRDEELRYLSLLHP